jgi:glycine cleavage system H protein
MFSLPDEKKYSRDHIWIEMDDEFIGRCGLSEQCSEKLDRILFVEFPEVNMEVRMGEKVARVESNKAFFDLISPVSGLIIEINSTVLTNPALINTDPLQNGWIYKIDVKEPTEFDELLDIVEYSDYIEMAGDI